MIIVLKVGTFNQKKALVGTFSVIVKTDCAAGGSFAALVFILISSGGVGGIAGSDVSVATLLRKT